MFGGENRVPESVKKAMLMEDYDKGKPLTARRILAIKAAVDADGTAKARSATIRLETIDDPANKAAMLAKGYTKAELPRLARSQLAADMDRPANYSIVGGQQDILGDDRGFLCSFPDGSFHKANGSEAGLAAIQTIADKVENLCGAVHREQASSVMTMLSQAGLGDLRGGLVGYGIAIGCARRAASAWCSMGRSRRPSSAAPACAGCCPRVRSRS